MAAKYSDDIYINDLYRGQEVTGPEVFQFIGHLSYGLYQLVCEIIGDEDVISRRRQVTVLQNEYRNIEASIEDYKMYLYLSGSFGEGFRFASSDVDCMIISRHVKIIESLTDQYKYDDNTPILLMENNMTKPGFVLMRLVRHAYDSDVKRSSVPYLSHTYVSSQKWRDENPCKVQSATIHGPCNSGVIGNTEYDIAVCLHSDTWPEIAYGCIQRLVSRQWPSFEVVMDIITGGVDFVPISSKESEHEFYEWRMSFSVAEKKLIHAMNHTQFMCYGLLKIFLKEAINNVEEIKSILCSYYVKTAVFWEILNPSTSWVPNALLCCFWKCFKKLITWIDNEYLPNFFIPENNMLIGKFQHGQKKKLMDHLNLLHCEGYSCLLRCPSLHDILVDVIHIPLTAYMLDIYNEEFKTCLYNVGTIKEISNHGPSISDILSTELHVLQVLTHLYSTYNDNFSDHVLCIWSIDHMQYLVYMYYCTILNDSQKGNKEFYRRIRTALNTINRCRTDCTSHYIYIALCLYRDRRYEDVIALIRKFKTRFQNPHLMYDHIQDINRYRAAGGANTPFTVMMRKYMARPVILGTTTCIPELRLEHQVADEHSTDLITFPPLVITELLYCLSCYHLGYHQLVRESVSDLHALVQYDEGYHIQDNNIATSWQILGICQELICDYQGAYQSYYNALQDQYTYIQSASRRRLEHLVSRRDG